MMHPTVLSSEIVLKPSAFYGHQTHPEYTDTHAGNIPTPIKQIHRRKKENRRL